MIGDELKKYTCSMCGETFESDFPEQDAMEEAKQEFGNIRQEQCGVLCDKCYKKFMEYHNAKKN